MGSVLNFMGNAVRTFDCSIRFYCVVQGASVGPVEVSTIDRLRIAFFFAMAN